MIPGCPARASRKGRREGKVDLSMPGLSCRCTYYAAMASPRGNSKMTRMTHVVRGDLAGRSQPRWLRRTQWTASPLGMIVRASTIRLRLVERDDDNFACEELTE